MTMSPYEGLPKRQFWRSAVTEDHVLSTTNLWRKKFDIGTKDRIASAGSCFAQHISRRLLRSGFRFLDVEPPPKGLPDALHARFGYATYSARYGNIYTAAQLLELAEEALGLRTGLPYSWEKEGNFYDPLRPNIEPSGLSSHDEVVFHREHHLERVRQLLKSCDVFVFTLGLTEAWVCRESGRTLPTAPGTIAGVYQPDRYELINFTHSQVKSALTSFMELVWSIQKRKRCRFLLTVSPVPLTATATDNHVIVATTYSKSTLRSVAGELFAEYDEVDYFPSYEIIVSPWSRGIFYAPNLRGVTDAGVDAAMRVFFIEHALPEANASTAEQVQLTKCSADNPDDDVVCEEALLEGFSR